jgi:hypothetical protein
VVVHTCNPSTWEAEAGGLTVQGQHGQHRKTLSQNVRERERERENKMPKRYLNRYKYSQKEVEF